MNRTSVTLFRTFAEDRRTSMDVYAEHLAPALRDVMGEASGLRECRPVVPDWLVRLPLSFNARMRFARYVWYPMLSRRFRGRVNHVLDHGYGHLLYALHPKKTVVTVHDLIPLLAWRGLIPGLSYPHPPLLNSISFRALRRAGAVITVSENSKRDLVNLIGVKEEKISVIPMGVGSQFVPMSAEEKRLHRARFGLSAVDAHVILITGRQEYKNHLSSLRVAARLEAQSSKPIQLVRLGGDYPGWRETLDRVPLKNHVICLPDVADHELPALYNAVDCLLFPSYYEGFGWPPLEAMACGTPVVVSTAGSLPEVVGDAGLMADPGDVESLADAVFGVLENPSLRSEHIGRGIARVQHFTWRRCAEKVAQVYASLTPT